MDDLDAKPLSFERVALLAVSSMARVELCRVTAGELGGKLVAVKRLPASMAEEDEQRAMFRDEIWMTSALHHPNITELLGWGEDDEGLYLGVEFVRGVSLARLWRTVLRTGEAFTERLVVYIGSLICAGLEHAHALRSEDGEFLNLVHRDLTPSNVLLSFEGEVKISDFGLAKAKQRVTSTAIGMTKGDPAYMSPEQVLGKDLDGRSDIFTLGILMFELFAQRRPWIVSGVVDALDKIVNGEAPKLVELCPKLDPVLGGLVDRCLAKDPADRFANVHELRQSLDEWLSLHGYEENQETLGRFVRRNAMRQMRWLDRALAGELRVDEVGPTPLEVSSDEPVSPQAPSERESRGGSTDPTRASALQPITGSGPVSAVTQPTRVGASVGGPSSLAGQPSVVGETAPMPSSPAAAPSQNPPAPSQVPPGSPRAGSTAYSAPPPAPLPRMASRPPAAPRPSAPPRPSRPPSSGTVSANATTMKRERAHTPAPHTRRRDAAPPLGAVRDSPVTLVESGPVTEAMTTLDPDATIEEPSTLKRSPIVGQISDIAGRLRLDAERLAEEARQAATDARSAAERAESASRAAHVAAAAAEGGAEALRRATHAMELVARGDVRAAVAEAQAARELHAKAMDPGKG